MIHETLHVWEFDREVAPGVAGKVSLDQLEPPDLEVVLLAIRGDVITVQVIDGSVCDPGSVLYVARRGLYEILRSEEWPPREGGAPRVLLTLRTWPQN